MKKSRGFTLIELLIVTVVIVTLMAIVFRLAGTGGESTARAKTLARLQKLSNALSGYYAAFGSYPPVPLQGRSRDYNTRVNSAGAKETSPKSDGRKGALGYGIQEGTDGPKIQLNKTVIVRQQIEAACRAQPVAVGFPYNPSGPEKDVIAVLCQQEGVAIYSPISNYGSFSSESSDWSKNNAFLFGLLSFLLPRYQFMLDGDANMYRGSRGGLWESNNRRPYLLNGKRLESWEKAQDYLGVGPDHYNSGSNNSDERAMFEYLPSQAVCARWMPNFKGIVTSRPVPTATTFFGVDTEDKSGAFGTAPEKWLVLGSDGYDSKSVGYVNGTKTVLDGWGEEFYYSSFPPYQSYQLWSSGKNKRTFPPWVDKSTLSQDEIKLVNDWIEDDIKVGDK